MNEFFYLFFITVPGSPLIIPKSPPNVILASVPADRILTAPLPQVVEKEQAKVPTSIIVDSIGTSTAETSKMFKITKKLNLEKNPFELVRKIFV